MIWLGLGHGEAWGRATAIFALTAPSGPLLSVDSQLCSGQNFSQIPYMVGFTVVCLLMAHHVRALPKLSASSTVWFMKTERWCFHQKTWFRGYFFRCFCEHLHITCSLAQDFTALPTIMVTLFFGFPNNVLEILLFSPFSAWKPSSYFSSLFKQKENIRREGVSLGIGFGMRGK